VSNQPISLGEEASVAQDLRGASPSAPRRLVALTADGALTQSLAELARGGVDIAVVTDAEALSEELLQSTSTIALIDAGTVGSMLEGLVDALATQFPDLRLLVAGHGTEQNQLATRISSGRVFRFVHKPASPQRLKLMVDAASRTADPQRVSVTQTVQVLPEAHSGPAARPGVVRYLGC
jgi:DNA-binding NtrC family response regulator